LQWPAGSPLARLEGVSKTLEGRAKQRKLN
jgi:hypothetical protein